MFFKKLFGLSKNNNQQQLNKAVEPDSNIVNISNENDRMDWGNRKS